MDPILEQREKLAGIRENCSKALDEARKRGDMKLTEDEQKKYDGWTAEADEVRQIIKNLESEERMKMETELDEEKRKSGALPPEVRIAPTDEESREAKEKEESREYEIFLGTHAVPLSDLKEEERALRVDQDTLGGYLQAPMQMQVGLLQAVDEMTVVRGMATTFPNITADSMGKVSLDTDPADPTWTTELDPGTEDSSMAFGQRELTPHELAQWIRISNKMLRRVPSITGIVTSRLAYKLALVQENAHLNGTGDGEPLGLMVADADGISTGRDMQTGNATTFPTLEGLKRAKYLLDDQYWDRAAWLFHPNILLLIDLLEDNQGRPLLQPDITSPTGQRLFGVPVRTSRRMPSTPTSALYVGIIGDFAFYYIADALTASIKVVDQLFAGTQQTAFYSLIESDGMPALEEAFSRVQLA